MMRLAEKIAVVVGAGQSPGEGIGNGRATVLRFAQEGAKILAVDRDLASAETRSRSTARIFAPSCAKRSTVARPLPIPSPGLCPAPTTIAIFPARRIIRVQTGPT